MRRLPIAARPWLDSFKTTAGARARDRVMSTSVRPAAGGSGSCVQRVAGLRGTRSKRSPSFTFTLGFKIPNEVERTKLAMSHDPCAWAKATKSAAVFLSPFWTTLIFFDDFCST